MKLKFKLTKSPHPDYLAWECVSGHGYYKGQAITPGSVITFSRWLFWHRVELTAARINSRYDGWMAHWDPMKDLEKIMAEDQQRKQRQEDQGYS